MGPTPTSSRTARSWLRRSTIRWSKNSTRVLRPKSTSFRGPANFGEPRKAEVQVPRIHFLGTPVRIRVANALLGAPQLVCWHHTTSAVSASNKGARTDEHLSYQDPA